MKVFGALVIHLVSLLNVFAEADGKFHPLLPGISAELLPLDLPNCNNVLYRHDGKLVALGYAGDLFLLTDSDGDGAEDHAELFWESKGRMTGQIGMDLAPAGSPHGNAVFLAVKGKIVMIADKDGDDRAEHVQTLAEGWPPARAGVDVTGLTVNPMDGSVWFGLGVRLYNDAYEIEETGIAQNDLSSERGAIYRISPDFKTREKICTGIRWPIALRFNRHGDLFCTDQEGATWLPNGNPFDELLHVQKGRHYGFPPRHPKHLPHVIDEPSVYDYGPQHQSACGMNFNESINGGPVFGPSWWTGDALVVGESRGKLYRTKLVRTEEGYVAHNEIIAGMGVLAIDACVSPKGEIRLCAHSGPPDWGTGPKGKGQIWRITYKDIAPQPVLTYRDQPDRIRIAFDRSFPKDQSFETASVIKGPNVRAGDRFETMRPGYEVVKRQLAEEVESVPVHSITFTEDRRDLLVKIDPIEEATQLGLELVGGYHLHADTSGVAGKWQGSDGVQVPVWLPHLDLNVARVMTKSSKSHDELWSLCQSAGQLVLHTQLDLWQMLHPAIQKGSQLDYEYAPETVTVAISSTSGSLMLHLEDRDETFHSTQGQVSHDVSFTKKMEENRWVPIRITLNHEGMVAPDLTVSWQTSEDRKHRAFPRRRFLLWTKDTPSASQHVAARPETQGGHWSRGKDLFFGAKAQCSLCHQWQGQGTHIGPDLSTLPHRDYSSVLRDIQDPSASINPDYPTHQIKLTSGQEVVAVPRTAADGSIQLGIGPGAILPVKKASILTSEPLAQSLMPAGIDQRLSKDEMRDLMTFLLYERPTMNVYASLPRDGLDHAPIPRERAEIDAVIAGAPEAQSVSKPLQIVLIAGPKDHGIGEHDYPRWQRVWSRLLSMTNDTTVRTAWEWPSNSQWNEADVLVFFKKGNWETEHTTRLNSFMQRGGGVVFVHWGCEAGDHAPQLAEIIGLASNATETRYRHGLLDLTVSQKSAHPITRGFDRVRFHDESYWKLVGDSSRLNVLATGDEEGESHPLFWTREHGAGRVFVSILGHYSWTFDDPLFRTLLLRGIAWTASEPVDRFNNLIDAGVETR